MQFSRKYSGQPPQQNRDCERAQKGADARRQTMNELTDSSGGALDIAPVSRVFLGSGDFSPVEKRHHSGLIPLAANSALGRRPPEPVEVVRCQRHVS